MTTIDVSGLLREVDEDDDDIDPILRKVHPDSVLPMLKAALKRVLDVLYEDDKASGVFTEMIGSLLCGNEIKWVRWTESAVIRIFNDDDKSIDLYLVDWGHPFTPYVELAPGVYGQLHTDEIKHLQRMLPRVSEAVQPHPRGHAWWAQEETFELLRPVMEGESARLRPDKGWIAVDANTYEVIKEAKKMSPPSRRWRGEDWREHVLDVLADEYRSIEDSYEAGVWGGYVEGLLSKMTGNGAVARNVAERLGDAINDNDVDDAPGGASHTSDPNAYWFWMGAQTVTALTSMMQRPVLVVTHRDKKGMLDGELVNVSITDSAGHIGLTLEANPDAVWVFDPDTLETLRVATYAEALDRSVPCARLRDIESGDI